MKILTRAGGLLLAALLTMAGCAPAHPPKTIDKPMTERELATRLLHKMDQQLSRKSYPFTLIIGDNRFEGQQSGLDWSLESVDQKKDATVRIVKKGEHIEVTRGKQKEKLTSRQFGLVSPRDYLQLIKSDMKRVERVSTADQGTEEVEAVLSAERIGNRLGHWMGGPFQKGAAQQASRKFQIRARFQYDTEQEGFNRLIIRIDPKNGEESESVEYRF